MTVHIGATRSADWLGVARFAGRLGLALGIALAMYLLVMRDPSRSGRG
jgi:hypothetical protein